MKKRFLAALLISFLLPRPINIFCAGTARADILVAVAANAQYVFQDLSAAFTKKTGIAVKSSIGSSGKFTAQVENGAPFDLFMSADMDYPQTLQKEGLTHNTPKVYGHGSLVLWTTTGADISKGLASLSDDSIRKVAIASPKTAPYGVQAVNAMKFYHLYPAISGKLVYGESIAQTNQFIVSKAVDAGITATSVVLAADMHGKGTWVKIDKKAYQPIAQGVVILKHAEENNLKEAEAFFSFLFSPEARDIFSKYGYTP